MQIVFDLQKDLINREKHGVSLGLANQLEWDWLLAMIDDRKDYAELHPLSIAFTVWCSLIAVTNAELSVYAKPTSER